MYCLFLCFVVDVFGVMFIQAVRPYLLAWVVFLFLKVGFGGVELAEFWIERIVGGSRGYVAYLLVSACKLRGCLFR